MSPAASRETTANATPDPHVFATVFGNRRRVQLVNPVGYYHVHVQAADGGKTGFYLITGAAVDPADARKFQAWVEWWNAKHNTQQQTIQHQQCESPPSDRL